MKGIRNEPRNVSDIDRPVKRCSIYVEADKRKSRSSYIHAQAREEMAKKYNIDPSTFIIKDRRY